MGIHRREVAQPTNAAGEDIGKRRRAGLGGREG